MIVWFVMLLQLLILTFNVISIVQINLQLSSHMHTSVGIENFLYEMLLSCYILDEQPLQYMLNFLVNRSLKYFKLTKNIFCRAQQRPRGRRLNFCQTMRDNVTTVKPPASCPPSPVHVNQVSPDFCCFLSAVTCPCKPSKLRFLLLPVPVTCPCKQSKLRFLCHLRSIAAHRDHFVRRLSVCPVCFLVVTHSYVSQATRAFLWMLPLFAASCPLSPVGVNKLLQFLSL